MTDTSSHNMGAVPGAVAGSERVQMLTNLTRNGGALVIILLGMYGLYLYESDRADQDHEARMRQIVILEATCQAVR